MNEEIKEIIDYLKDEDEYYKEAEEVIVGYGDLIVEKEDIDKLLDYITNLQEENERLKERKKDLLDENIDLENIRKEAIEYINEEQQKIDEMGDNYCYLDEYEINDLLNILQGENKDE